MFLIEVLAGVVCGFCEVEVGFIFVEVRIIRYGFRFIYREPFG